MKCASCNEISLLLTSSVYVSTSLVQITDANIRACLVLESIEHWTRIDKNLKIVICDGSGYDFTPEIASRFPKSNIECLYFENDKSMVKQCGKGYGEGEIIEFALTHSRILKTSKIFAKCTGKLWIENFREILLEYKGNFQCQLSVENLFSLKNARLSFVDTRFYIADKNFYIEYLLKAYVNVRDHDGYFLEHCFKDVFIGNSIKVSHFLFWTPPALRGVSGSSGDVYEEENLARRWIINRFKSLVLKLHERFFLPISDSSIEDS